LPAAWEQQLSDSSLAVGTRVWVTIGYSTNSTEFSERGWRDIDNIRANLLQRQGSGKRPSTICPRADPLNAAR